MCVEGRGEVGRVKGSFVMVFTFIKPGGVCQPCACSKAMTSILYTRCP